MDKYNVKYVPSWSKKSPCVPKKRSKLTVCGKKAEDTSGTVTEEPSGETTARLDDSKQEIQKGFDIRDSPAHTFDDMAMRLIAPFPSEYVRSNEEVSFHIPHKRILQKLNVVIPELEPLPGYADIQSRRKRPEPPEPEKIESIESLVVKYEDDELTARRRRPPPDLVDVKELINRMRSFQSFQFFYLNYGVPRTSEFYTPYTFRIVPFEQIDKRNFLTISTFGVMLHSPGEIVFTSLDDWERDYDFFCQLRKIRVFKLFRMWKAFYLWKKEISWKKYTEARLKLALNLFILNPTLKEALLEIRHMCVKLEYISFADLIRIEHFHLFEFIEVQMGKMEKVRDKLTEFREIVKNLVNTACHGALMVEGYTTDDSNVRLSQCGLHQRRPKDGILRMSYTEQANKRRVCERLSSFINLVDYLLVEVYHACVSNTLRELNDSFKKHTAFLPTEEMLTNEEPNAPPIFVPRPDKSPQHPFFFAAVFAEVDGLIIDPSELIFIDAFKQVMDLYDSSVMNMPVFVQDPFFLPFIEPVINDKHMERLIGEGPSVEMQMLLDTEIQNLKSEIIENLKVNFAHAQLYIRRLIPIQTFYKENCMMDHNLIIKETIPSKMRYYLEKYHDQIDEIERVSGKQTMGMLMLLLEDFKKEVMPSPLELLKITEKAIPKLGSSKVEALTKECTDAVEYLEIEPTTTLEFVNHLQFIDDIFERLDGIETEIDYAKEIYDIIEEFQVPVPRDEIDAYYNTSSVLTTLRNLCEKKIIDKPNILNRFNVQLSKDISNLISEVGVIQDEAIQDWLIQKKSNPEECKFTLNMVAEQLADCQRRAQEIKGYQKQFKMEVTRFEMLDEVINDVKLRQLLWDSLDLWKKTYHEYMYGDFNTLVPEDVNMFVAKLLKNIAQLDKGLPKNDITWDFKEEVEKFRERIPVITHLRNPTLKARHWLKIEAVLNHKFVPGEIITLEQLEELGAFNAMNELQEISAQASSEAALEALLKKVEDNWKELEFIVLGYRDSKDVFILGGLEEIQQVLDDSFINVNTILSSRNVGPIKPRVEEWLRLLDLFSKTIEEWWACQTNWLYLESIFSAPDIQRQLPNEAKMFLIVDKAWKDVMRRTYKNPLALQTATTPGTLEMFQNNNKLLDQIMKCLEAYLESKRVIFPRFYFLSNEELLEILAQTRNPHAVQPHLRKCFDAIAKLEFGVSGKAQPGQEAQLTTDIIAMLSPEGERVPLGKGLKARGNVEDWLGKVEESMLISLRKAMRTALVDHMQKERVVWVLNHASQIVLTVSQIMWCKRVHQILDGTGNKLEEMAEFENVNFSELNRLAAMVRGNLTKLGRMVLCSLITIDVHARDNITTLVKAKVVNSQDFEWLKCLRYYWDEAIDNCVARMSSAYYVYGYEYLGASPRLVITPLTDKCYLCLMGALQLDLGGAPAGPAGTGKTETTKDLAKSLAIQCVVFNCSEGLDYKMMGRFFAGLAQSGAWCCFDEFNRIDIEVLSVIAQQLITIRNAKAAKLSRFMFEGREIKLVQQCAAFITMNPGYAGRTELPDNLKALFRPMAMMVPDYALIAEVILYSEGFESSKILAHKMTQMYKLCSEQLSQQDHYDFGMRAVKSVLVMAGSLKRENPDKSEDVVLIRALRDSNLPKFLADDAVLFQGILSDLFPGVVLPEQDYGNMQKAIVEVMEEAGLQPELCMIRKVIQLYETMLVRHGVMLVGPTGGGKTTVLNTLKQALTRLYENKIENPYYRPVNTYILNPKSITIGELYGEVNLMTLEWKDGVLGMAVRTAVQATNDDHQWVICDGPVDAVWIENMNTVLDDNKMLCLANSERIKLTPYVHMVFEVQDLAQASPATVSRCGMVYIDPDELKWMPYVKTWSNRLPESIGLLDEHKKYMLALFDTHIDDCLYYLRKNCTVGIHQVEISKVITMCKLLESIFLEPNAIEKGADRSKVRTLICQCFVFCMIWALGGNINEQHRDSYETFVRSRFEENEDAKLSTAADLWSLYVDAKNKRQDSWAKIIPEFVYEAEVPFFEILVPTQDTVRFGYLMKKLLDVNQGVLFTGNTGVGKSVIAKSVLNAIAKEDTWVPVTLNFSAQTSSSRTQEMIEIKLEKKKKTLLGAPVGKRVIVFVDDVNMPRLDTYGSQPPIELLRQYLDFGGLYDREKLFWKEIHDVVISAACAPPGGGRNPLTPRFVRHFSMFLIPSPSESALKTIFKAIMQGFLADFVPAMRELATPIVNAATEIYERISVDLLPTPAKSHYVFNLRDLSKCIQGTLQADPGTTRENTQILRLFYHECLRVFHDRLVNKEDKSYFYFLMRDICSRQFGTPVLFLEEEAVIQHPPLLLFGDFINPSTPKEDRIYEEIRNVDKLKQVLQDYLEDYNLITAKDMKIIFFMDAVEHCARLARILRAERGNGLLVGVGGMGKQSLTKLASHVNGYKCFQIELTRSYDHSSFHEDLRKVYFSAGAKGDDTAFLFTDSQIVQEEFLEDINNILNSGEVPNLFESDEYEKVIQAVRPLAKEAGISEGNRDKIYEYFISRVRSKLHVVLCMSPIGDAFRRRCRMFPSLVNCCTIDWFLPWPTEALLSVAEDSFKNVVENPELGSKLSSICVTMHESVEHMTYRLLVEKRRYYYTTPSSYLELLKLFKHMLKKKTEDTIRVRERIGNGLKKLYETNAVVDTMKAELVAFEPQLVAKSEATNALMKHLAKEQAAADQVRQIVLADEAVAKEKAAETQELADDAQRDLAEAMPAMEMAMKALEALNKNDINELKVFNKPPELVRVVMEAVCLLLGAKQDWATAKVVLADVNFLKKLQEYDKDHMNDGMLKVLKNKYINNPDFIPDKVATQSKVCKSLCMWVRALDVYAKVFKVVEPKRRALEAAENELNSIMSVLRDKQKKLAEVEAQIANLEAMFDASVAEKAELEATMALTAARLSRSGRLTSALGDEQIRWEQQVQMYTEQLANMIGDVLVGAACVAYQGAFTSDYREEMTQLWLEKCFSLKIPASKTFSVITVLADPYEIRMWNTFGLPRDNISTENAILVTKGARWPLMIDPQEQANRWIRNMEAENNLKICKLTDSNYMRILEGCIRIGTPCLLEEVGEALDPTLTPILLKQTFVQGGRLMIRLGDTDVEYDNNFKFYITTKLGNPHYLPEICILVTLVNFTVSPSGLEDQLLADVVRLERPDLEKTRTELITRINNDKQQLKSIEDKILKLLFTSTGNILDDEELIDTLNESKETTEVIATRLQETEATEEKISVARNKYRIVATRGSVLFFVVAQLSEIDPMYQYSLKYFTYLFNNVIEISEKAAELQKRLQILIDEITVAVYTNISRGLFERHKLVFSFMLCISIMKHQGLIPDDYWNFLLRGPPSGVKVEAAKKPEHPALSETVWTSANYLSQNFASFKELEKDVMTKIRAKVGDYDYTININVDNKRENQKKWNDLLNNFEKLVLFKALREEKLVFAMSEFVKTNLGKTFIESPQIDLHKLYLDTSNVTPLIFVLSTGSDPFGAFQRFAADRGFLDRIQSISLGQGQGPVADKMINSAIPRGDWVFLQNCHLATSWMIPMERKILSIADNPEKVHPDFRIFISSMPSKSFPVAVLQNSVKVTNEPPKGLRANVKRAFFEMSRDYFEDNPLQADWRKMVFGLCFFHAIIQERKKFGPLGWNITYEFNDSDRECALNNLKMFCAEGTIPWDALEYITGEITYGGRVTDGWDQRCLKTILKGYFSPPTLAPGYKYSASGTYYCPESPECSTLAQYRTFTDNLPLIEEPEIFGMHENANIAFQIKETQSVILTILEVQPRESGGTGMKTSDEIAYDLAESIKERIVSKIDPDKCLPDLIYRDAKGRLPSLTTVLFQEVDRFNKLLRVLHASLENLKKAIKGLLVMSEQLEEVYKAFIKNQVPKMWEKVAYPSLKSLGSWIRDLELRLDFVVTWVQTGHPMSYWLSGFFFPQGFLTGVLQTHARKYDTPIDQLKFDYIMQGDSVDQEEIYKAHKKHGKDVVGIYGNLHSPKDGVLIHGLFLDAARWDYKTMLLTDPLPGEMNPPLPAMLLNPQTTVPSSKGKYVCPLYKTSIRAGVLSTTGHSTNFVVPVLLPSDREESVWIIKGTALLTQITD